MASLMRRQQTPIEKESTRRLKSVLHQNDVLISSKIFESFYTCTYEYNFNGILVLQLCDHGIFRIYIDKISRIDSLQ